MGFPFDGGWAEQPFWIAEMIGMFEEAYNQEESHNHKTRMDKSKSKSDSSSDTKNKTLTGSIA